MTGAVADTSRRVQAHAADLRGIVASYPRSGLNWVRYCVEHFSGRPTPGRPLLHREGAPILHRSHDLVGRDWWGPVPWPTLLGPDGLPQYRRLVLLLRNYKEGLACEGMNDLGRMRPYVANLLAWVGFGGDKLLVHYEDLMSDFAWMERVLDFLDIDHEQPGFELDRHRETSRLIYHARRGVGAAHSPLDFTFHSRRLSPARRAEADAWFQEHLGAEVYGRHLARYHEAALRT